MLRSLGRGSGLTTGPRPTIDLERIRGAGLALASELTKRYGPIPGRDPTQGCGPANRYGPTQGRDPIPGRGPTR